MKKTLITILILCIFTLCGCAPQQTDIYTEVRSPDGTVSRYVNKSNGFGYNPNATSNVNVGGIQGTNNTNIIQGGWGYGNVNYGGYYCPPNYGGFYYAPGCVYTPGAMPIPQNLNVYNYNPIVRNNGVYYPANPYCPPSN